MGATLADLTSRGVKAPDLRDHIRAVNGAYAAFPRHELDTPTILARKLETSHWRAATLSRILAEARGGGMRGADLADALLELNLYLFPDDRKRIERLLPDREAVARVFARMGVRLPDVHRYHRAAGPEPDLTIEANRDSPWPFERWKRMEAFSEYEEVGTGIRFRGIDLYPGDVILTNVNLDGNFIFSSLPDPKSIFPHAAFFVMLEDEGRRYPAVVETYEKGVRAVPLSIFLNARYIAYAEVFRHGGIDEASHGELGRVALDIIRHIRGYNFQSCEADPHYTSCTYLGNLLFEEVGARPVEPRSGVVHPGILQTLGRVDYVDLDPFFAPVDYLLHEDFLFVGVVDNNQFARTLTREVVEHVFRKRVEEGRLGHRRFPFPYYFTLWGIRRIRKNSLVGRIVSRFAGFDHESLPKGPDRIIAIIPSAEAELARAVRNLLPFVEQRLEELEDFDFQAFLNDPELQQIADERLGMPWL